MTTEPEDDVAAALDHAQTHMRRGMDLPLVPSPPMSPESVKAGLMKLYGYDLDAVTVERDAVEPNRINVTLPTPSLLSVTFTAEQGGRLQAWSDAEGSGLTEFDSNG